jgi:hypothetical protein
MIAMIELCDKPLLFPEGAGTAEDVAGEPDEDKVDMVLMLPSVAEGEDVIEND